MKVAVLTRLSVALLIAMLHVTAWPAILRSQPPTPSYSLFLPFVSLSPPTWHQTSQGMETADFSALAVSSAYVVDKTLFAGTLMATAGGTGGSVHKSVDGGMTWQPANQGLSGYGVFVLAISPGRSSDHTLFVGTVGGALGSLYKSTDDGISWRRSGTFIQATSDIALSPDYPSDHTAFAATEDGVYRSSDAGATWSGVFVRPNSYYYYRS